MRFASMQQDPTGAAITAAGPPPGVSAPPVPVVPVVPGTGLVSPADSGTRDLNENERFSDRAGNKEVEVVRAQRLPNQNTLVAQGTIIGAVMETALNSDVPGFARAVVTRDVLSFDGSQVLIPAGSHVVGEYKSGVAQGASRIFIVWNRLVRPDGVTVGLGSPAVDDLGRGGLGGKVNRHFLQRFGGAILLSVLTGGISALTQSVSRGSTVIVSSTNEATSLAGQATRGTDIPPTITTRQGALVRIFVARDLDFSAVGPSI
jgi:type IV secretion system protein VirB10